MLSGRMRRGADRRPEGGGPGDRHRACRHRPERQGPAGFAHLSAHPLRTSRLQMHGGSTRAPRSLLAMDQKGGRPDRLPLARRGPSWRLQALGVQRPAPTRARRPIGGHRCRGCRGRLTLGAPFWRSQTGAVRLSDVGSRRLSRGWPSDHVVNDLVTPKREDLTSLVVRISTSSLVDGPYRLPFADQDTSTFKPLRGSSAGGGSESSCPRLSVPRPAPRGVGYRRAAAGYWDAVGRPSVRLEADVSRRACGWPWCGLETACVAIVGWRDKKDRCLGVR